MSEQIDKPPPEPQRGVDVDGDAIRRDEAQTERQAPNDADPGEPSGGE